ncbi:phosphotransferase [Paenibacillus filicis]|uniref:Phosphotransferase n=1 Tax=Paenibacillus gyeongsangnamensis TaxID=3388067 RepID=A0ABT4QCV8_9BACL|nr:oxidoreductase family protein [Paenibacillus filicis]MCZ8514695.1 phosphotransferase [Paenibacillus filicis]
MSLEASTLWTHAPDTEQLRRVLQRMLESDDLALLTWNSHPIGSQHPNPVTGGVYRFRGMAGLPGCTASWSVILKVSVRDPERDHPSHYNYWKREALIYQSGLLGRLPDRIRAPRCYGVEERPDGSIWLWLEDMEHLRQADWSLTSMEAAAFIAGRFNGAYLCGLPLPEPSFLRYSWMGSWVSVCEAYACGLAEQDDAWTAAAQLPSGWQAALSSIRSRYRESMGDKGHLLEALERLPRVFVHQDLWPPNLYFPEEGGHTDALHIIDWQFAGISGIGEELGRFYGLYLSKAASHGLQPPKDRLLEQYLKGLRKAGWNGDERLVRFGLNASAGLRIVMVLPKLLNAIAGLEGGGFRCLDKAEKLRHTALELLNCLEEASQLLHELWPGEAGGQS